MKTRSQSFPINRSLTKLFGRHMLLRRLPVLAVSAALVRSVVSLESLYSLSARSLDGHEVPLSEYKGRVSLVVNVACE